MGLARYSHSSHIAATNSDVTTGPAITAANTCAIIATAGGHSAASNADVPASPAVTAADTRSIFPAGSGHSAATDGNGAASFIVTAADTRSVFPAGGGHSATSNGDAVTADASGLVVAGGVCVYCAAIDDEFAHSSVNTTICCIHNTTIDGDGAVCSSDVRSTITTCFNLTAVDGNSTAITIDSCSERAYIPFSRFGHDWLGIDGQANTIVHRDTLGF